VYVDDIDSPVSPQGINTRDYLRQVFFEKGIEIEFRYKRANERGVVIDLDTKLMQNFGLDTEVLKFRQTVVRIGSLIT
jgi:hypothetical protein